LNQFGAGKGENVKTWDAQNWGGEGTKKKEERNWFPPRERENRRTSVWIARMHGYEEEGMRGDNTVCGLSRESTRKPGGGGLTFSLKWNNRCEPILRRDSIENKINEWETCFERKWGEFLRNFIKSEILRFWFAGGDDDEKEVKKSNATQFEMRNMKTWKREMRRIGGEKARRRRRKETDFPPERERTEGRVFGLHECMAANNLRMIQEIEDVREEKNIVYKIRKVGLKLESL
jgi:hypothetical protein